ncbi:hypothetical protein F511_17259 [Dorcoceras hygrometricum]|uniref:Uncharacterized protein n=1 Tax=Dorcoceras hygrometricum TaxID=472368 RepID=A0A2Z7B3N8_9LAMI|nr:hypothetical protein F511_17259 [Dorcoceras hygrometricum]
MLKEMGNENTSGIVEKEQVGCPDYMEQENEIEIQQTFDAKATKSDSCDTEVNKSPSMEIVSQDEKEAIDGYPREVCETKANGLPDSASKDEEVIEDHNQSSADIAIASNPQEMRTLSHSEQKYDARLLVQNRASNVDSSIDDDHVIVKVETETPSIEGESIEMTTHQENCDLLRNIGNTENGIINEKGKEDHPKVEMDSSLNAPHGLQTVSKDTSAMECEVKDEHVVLEETIKEDKSSSEPNTSYVDDETMAEEEVQFINEVDQTLKEIGLVETKGSVREDENGEEEKLTDKMTIEEIDTIGNKSSALCKDREDETTTEEWSPDIGSSLEIKKVNETKHPAPEQYSKTETATPQVPQSNGVAIRLVFPKQYTNYKTPRLLVIDQRWGESTEERCGLISESSLEIKKMDEPVLLPEPEHELEPGYAYPNREPLDKTSSTQVPEPNGGENIMEMCKLTSVCSSQIKKVDESESRHSPPEQISNNETSRVQVPELNGGENTVEKCRSTCEFSMEIEQVSKFEHELEPDMCSRSSIRTERSTLHVLGQNRPDKTLERWRSISESCFEVKTLHESDLASKSECKPKVEPDSKQKLPESKEGETIEKLCEESIPNHPIIQLARKSPSFEFGIPFDSRSEESDQTPLLYQDRTAPRRFSSCSSYVGPLHQEAVEVEEKTLRMERSTSDVSRSPFLNLLKEEKPENSASDNKDQENGFQSSLPTEECDGISTRLNRKGKPRSSLFTTCICCASSALS